MSWKRKSFELGIWLFSLAASRGHIANPKSIFVLRNNDIGDLLVITPLFEALKRRFPTSEIVAGVGSWNFEVLQNNPFVSKILPVHAPWHNKFVSRQGLGSALRYIFTSHESKSIAQHRFDIGIDVLGSPFGSLLMMRAGIPYRLGVKGYAGGHSAVQKYVKYDPAVHVGQSALQFAELLGASELPDNRPQIFLSDDEREMGEHFWLRESSGSSPKRIIIGPGGGFAEKCWPLEYYIDLTKKLSVLPEVEIIIVGGKQDSDAGSRLAECSSCIQNRTGELSLRQTFAAVAATDLVICNSSMLMHVAAAFEKPALVLLGDYYPSATAHADQWGYGKLTLVLGKEAQKNKIYFPKEVFEIIQVNIIGNDSK